MKLIIVISITIGLIIGCGKAEENSTGGPSSKPSTTGSTGCPSGSWASLDTYNRVTVGNTGMITLNMNGCVSTGTVTCLGGQNFVMNLLSKSKEALDINECQGLGEWTCTYSFGGGVISMYCPENKEGNVFSPARTFSQYW